MKTSIHKTTEIVTRIELDTKALLDLLRKAGLEIPPTAEVLVDGDQMWSDDLLEIRYKATLHTTEPQA